MTEEVRQAVEDAFAERSVGYYARQMARDFVAAIEAKLSPKHPPKGAIFEVWNDGCYHHYRQATGGGEFAKENDDEEPVTYDHYREIPTAADALAALRGQEDGFTYWHADNKPVVNSAIEQGFRMGMEAARNGINYLIDHAMEG